MMKRCFMVILIVLLSISTYTGEIIQEYIKMPVEAHLIIAKRELGRLAHNMEKPTVEVFVEISGLIQEAMKKYDRYLYSDKDRIGLGDEEEAVQMEIPDGASPLSLMEHLWIAGDAMTQVRAGIMISAQRLTQDQSDGLQALTEAVKLLDKALRLLESSDTDLWTVHFMAETRTMISLPPDFKYRSPNKSELLRLVRTDNNDKPTGLFYILRLWESDGASQAKTEGFVERRIDKVRERFPDMEIKEIGEFSTDGYASANSFTYEYTWEKELITALVYIYADGGGMALEIIYAVPSGIFDKKEADCIIQSMKRI